MSVCDPSTSCNASKLFDQNDTTLRCSTFTLQSKPSVSELHELLRGMTTTVGCKEKETRRLEKLHRRTKAEGDKQLWQIQFEHQRQKLRGYWTSTIDSCRGDSKAVWSKPRTHRIKTQFSADGFADFFTSKVDKIRASTLSAPPLVIKEQPAATPFSSFEPVCVDEVTRPLSRSPAKHCSLDPVPTWLVKCASDVLAPVLSEICNASLQSGDLPDTQKSALFFPRLKKPMDAEDANSCRSISNLSFVS